VVVAADDPLIGGGGARDFGDHVVDRFQVPVGFHFQMDLCDAGADVVGEAESAAPVARRNLAGDCGEKWFRVTVGNRQNRNLREYRDIL
jgi:hypothetical protein